MGLAADCDPQRDLSLILPDEGTAGGGALKLDRTVRNKGALGFTARWPTAASFLIFSALKIKPGVMDISCTVPQRVKGHLFFLSAVIKSFLYRIFTSKGAF